MKERRMSNYELLRILAMLSIVFYHCILHQLDQAWKVLDEMPLSFNYMFTVLIGSWGGVANIIFVIISSWFLVDKKGIHTLKLISLAGQAWIISVLITVTVLIMRLESVSLFTIVKEILTPIYHQYGFLLSYLIFYMLVPFCQFFVQHISDMALKSLCGILTLCMPVYTLIFNEQSGGFAMFIYLFIVTAYLKKQENSMLDKYRWLFFAGSFGSMVVVMLTVKGVTGRGYTGLFGNNILSVLMGFSIFYIFKNLKVRQSRLINYISGKSFGIYLFHENILCYSIWDKIFHMSQKGKSSLYIVYYIGSVLIVYIVCLLLECIRTYLIDDWLFGRKKFEIQCKRIDENIEEILFKQK